MAPFAPHITEELWYQIGHEKTIHVDQWPQWDDAYLVQNTMTIIVQVNGKVRAKLTVPADETEESIKQQAVTHENVVKFTAGNEPKKVIYVAGRLVSIVA